MLGFRSRFTSTFSLPRPREHVGSHRRGFLLPPHPVSPNGTPPTRKWTNCTCLVAQLGARGDRSQTRSIITTKRARSVFRDPRTWVGQLSIGRGCCIFLYRINWLVSSLFFYLGEWRFRLHVPERIPINRRCAPKLIPNQDTCCAFVRCHGSQTRWGSQDNVAMWSAMRNLFCGKDTTQHPRWSTRTTSPATSFPNSSPCPSTTHRPPHCTAHPIQMQRQTHPRRPHA